MLVRLHILIRVPLQLAVMYAKHAPVGNRRKNVKGNDFHSLRHKPCTVYLMRQILEKMLGIWHRCVRSLWGVYDIAAHILFGDFKQDFDKVKRYKMMSSLNQLGIFKQLVDVFGISSVDSIFSVTQANHSRWGVGLGGDMRCRHYYL